MTKLASTLPEEHGFGMVGKALIETPRQRHLVIGYVSTSKVTDDYDKGGREPTVAFRQLEVVTNTDDAALGAKLFTRAEDRRNGATILPLDLESQLGTDIFKVRSEDVTTDLAGESGHLDDAQAKDLARSIDEPLRHEIGRAINVLRSHGEWVTLGRARRVLQLALRQFEENDKNLLRDDDGRLVDPRTGEIVEEDKLTSEDLDEMLAALGDQDEANDDLDLDDTA